MSAPYSDKTLRATRECMHELAQIGLPMTGPAADEALALYPVWPIPDDDEEGDAK